MDSVKTTTVDKLICQIGGEGNIAVANKSGRLLMINKLLTSIQSAKEYMKRNHPEKDVQYLQMDLLQEDLPVKYYHQVAEIHVTHFVWNHFHLFTNPTEIFIIQIKAIFHALSVCWNMLELQGAMTVISSPGASFLIQKRCVELLGDFNGLKRKMDFN